MLRALRRKPTIVGEVDVTYAGQRTKCFVISVSVMSCWPKHTGWFDTANLKDAKALSDELP